jgi:hypothetical protein
MGILEKFFPAKTIVTSAIIRAEISKREIESRNSRRSVRQH